jgi:hypothetical protein
MKTKAKTFVLPVGFASLSVKERKEFYQAFIFWVLEEAMALPESERGWVVAAQSMIGHANDKAAESGGYPPIRA